jgi:hypothetical protein
MYHIIRTQIAFFYKLLREEYKIVKEICFLIKEYQILYKEVEHAI